MSQIEKPQKIILLHYFRGVAAIAVMLGHVLVNSRVQYMSDVKELFGDTFEPHLLTQKIFSSASFRSVSSFLESYQFPHNLGPIGVSLFFLISGYVISLSFQQNTRITDFAKSRFIRIYPVHWAALIVILLVSLVTFSLGTNQIRYSSTTVVLNFLNIQEMFRKPSINPVLWSLWCEQVFYVTIAIQFLLTRKITRTTTFLSVASLVFVVGLRYLLNRIGQRLAIIDFAAYASCHVIFIYLGTLVYIYDRQVKTRRNQLEKYLVLLSGFLIFKFANLLYRKVGGLDDFPFMSYFFSLAVFLGIVRFKNVAFESRILDFFANISYPLYLVHVTIGWIVLYSVSRLTDNYVVSIAASLLAPVAVATLIHNYVEKPAIKLSKKSKVRAGTQ